MRLKVRKEGFYDGSICREGKIVTLPDGQPFDPAALAPVDKPPAVLDAKLIAKPSKRHPPPTEDLA